MKLVEKTVIDAESINEYFHNSDSFATRLGIEITEVGSDCAVAIMPLTDTHRNGMGNAHGGAIFSLADMAFAAAAHASGIFFVSAQANISFLEPGRVGPLRGEAKQVRFGRTLGIYNIRILDALGTLVAIGTITGYNTHIPISELDKYRENNKTK